MKAEYDLSKFKSRKNPYAAQLKKPVSMRLSEDVVRYFKDMAKESGVPYQSLINLYLRDCVARHRKVPKTNSMLAARLAERREHSAEHRQLEDGGVHERQRVRDVGTLEYDVEEWHGSARAGT